MNKTKLKVEMLRSNINQNDIARELNMTSATLSRKINGKSDFKLDEAKTICRLLGIKDPALRSEIFLC